MSETIERALPPVDGAQPQASRQPEHPGRAARLVSTARRTADRVSYRALAWGLTLVAAVGFLLQLFAGMFVFHANSDSVAQQNMVQSMLDGEPADLVTPPAPWVLRFPIYVLTSLMSNGQAAQMLEVVLVHGVLFVGLVYFLRTYLRLLFGESRLALVVGFLVVGWFVSLAARVPGIEPVAGTLQNVDGVMILMTPNHRNLEAGLALVVLAVFARWGSGSWVPRRRLTGILVGAAVVLALALTFLSDPYFLALGAALAAAIVVLWMVRSFSLRKACVGLGVVVASGVVYVVADAVVSALGLRVVQVLEQRFILPDQVVGNLTNVATAVLVTGRASLAGLGVGPAVAVVGLNLALILLIVWGVVSGVRRQLREPDAVRLPALVFIVVGLCAFTFSTLGADRTSFRYVFVPLYIALPFAVDPLLRMARDVRWKTLVVGILVLGLAVNVASNVKLLAHEVPQGTDRFYANSEVLIDELEEDGFTKGYTSYWNANINTYLAQRDVLFLPIVPRPGGLERFDFLINTADFDVPSDDSFLLITEGEEYADAALAQFGEPESTEVIPGYATVYYYDHDIGAALPHFTTER